MTNVSKKPDFNSLTFSGVRQENKTPVVPEVKDEKKIDGAWLYGQPVSEITPTEFKEWLNNHFPKQAVDNWGDSQFKTASQKSATITRVADLYGVILCLPKKKSGKSYSN